MSWRWIQDFHLTSSWFQGDDVTNFCDGVKVADKEKPKKIRQADGVKINKRHHEAKLSNVDDLWKDFSSVDSARQVPQGSNTGGAVLRQFFSIAAQEF
ncbi:hypothetical protein Tco_0200840, partial [Tanacetum coccineum]